MEASEGDVESRTGKFTVKGTDKGQDHPGSGLRRLRPPQLPPDLEPGLEASAFYDPINFTYPAGCQISGGWRSIRTPG